MNLVVSDSGQRVVLTVQVATAVVTSSLLFMYIYSIFIYIYPDRSHRCESMNASRQNKPPSYRVGTGGRREAASLGSGIVPRAWRCACTASGSGTESGDCFLEYTNFPAWRPALPMHHIHRFVIDQNICSAWSFVTVTSRNHQKYETKNSWWRRDTNGSMRLLLS